MLAFNLLALAVGAVTAAAFPTVHLPRYETGPWCNNLGGGAFDKALNVTLAAYNATGTNTNDTGAPLVLATGGFFSNFEVRRFATWDSFPANDYPTVSLLNGTIILNGGEDVNPARATEVQEGSPLSFVTNPTEDPLAGSQIYCGVASTSAHGGGTGFPRLAVNGDTDSFSLCRVGSQNVVFWKPIPDQGETGCYPVFIQIIEDF
ncbi:hypothetical protein C8Q78DRAFT_550000 [Trametes maxima]|nr:hypothetical protein C8Q78DRAFT_550000 [Trametes maxima]